jgi:hypothetical protein
MKLCHLALLLVLTGYTTAAFVTLVVPSKAPTRPKTQFFLTGITVSAATLF